MRKLESSTYWSWLFRHFFNVCSVKFLYLQQRGENKHPNLEHTNAQCEACAWRVLRVLFEPSRVKSFARTTTSFASPTSKASEETTVSQAFSFDTCLRTFESLAHRISTRCCPLGTPVALLFHLGLTTGAQGYPLNTIVVHGFDQLPCCCCYGAGDSEEGCVLVLSARETSPSEWRAGLAEAASIGDSYADAASVEASGLKTVFDRRVRLTVLRAAGLAQVQTIPELTPLSIKFTSPKINRLTRYFGFSINI